MLAAVALVLAGLGAIVALNILARRAGLPAAVVLVIAGLVYALLPGPDLTLRPSIVLDVIIPPLLYAAAVNSSAIAIRRSGRAVISLAIGLVLATAFAVGGVLHVLVPAVSLPAAVALGAAVAPPDPVAALAIGRRAGLPPRLITIVEGEGLLNDATALTLFQVAVAAAVGGAFSFPGAVGKFALAAVGGVASGLVVAIALGWVRRRLRDTLSDNAISLGTPFAAYLLAQSFGGSGVLAVVIAGLWFSHRGPSVQSGESRLQSRAVWSLVDYLLEGFVFLLIGQQLPAVLRGLQRYDWTTVAVAAASTIGVMLLIRPLWLVVSELLPAELHTRLAVVQGSRHARLSGSDITALSWSGTRGVISLAAAFSLPFTMDSGAALPGRDLLLACAYVAVLVTLVGQGATLVPLLRRLGFGDAAPGDALLRNQARAAGVQAALARLDEIAAEEKIADEITEPLRRAATIRVQRYTRRAERLSSAEDIVPADDPYYTAIRVRRSMISAERDELLNWRDTGRLSDRSLRILQRELDHQEGQLPPA